jgi:hypothetical protein
VQVRPIAPRCFSVSAARLQRSPKTKPPRGAAFLPMFSDYILSLFFILEDLDIFFLLILPLGMLSFDMLSPL